MTEPLALRNTLFWFYVNSIHASVSLNSFSVRSNLQTFVASEHTHKHFREMAFFQKKGTLWKDILSQKAVYHLLNITQAFFYVRTGLYIPVNLHNDLKITQHCNLKGKTSMERNYPFTILHIPSKTASPSWLLLGRLKTACSVGMCTDWCIGMIWTGERDTLAPFPTL